MGFANNLLQTTMGFANSSLQTTMGFANSSLRTISISFLTNTKNVHSLVGMTLVCSFLDSQDVKALRGSIRKQNVR